MSVGHVVSRMFLIDLTEDTPEAVHAVDVLTDAVMDRLIEHEAESALISDSDLAVDLNGPTVTLSMLVKVADPSVAAAIARRTTDEILEALGVAVENGETVVSEEVALVDA